MTTTRRRTASKTLRTERIRAVAARAAVLPWEMERVGDNDAPWEWRGVTALQEGAAPISVINMDTIYESRSSSTHTTASGLALTLTTFPNEAKGCLAGLTLTMFPEDAKRFWNEQTSSPSLDAAQRVLGLDSRTAAELFEGQSSGKKLHELERDQMLRALERAAAGAVGAEVWQ